MQVPGKWPLARWLAGYWPGTEGLQALVLLLALGAVHKFVTETLQTPELFLAWAGDLSDQNERFFLLGAADDLVVLIVDQWFVFPLLVATTIVGWLKGWRLVMLLPLGLYNCWTTILLVASMGIMVASMWSPAATAEALLPDTAAALATNLLVFTTWYWLIDHGRQHDFAAGRPTRLHFMFPQQANALAHWNDWEPSILDYLWLAFVSTSQFGPSDTLVLTRRAKMLVALEAVLGILAIVVVVARATNIIKS
jgi:hypothetical protein